MSEVYGGHVVKSLSIENLLNQRDAILERITNAIETLREAQEIAVASRIADSERYRGFEYILQGDDHYRRTDLLEPSALASIRKRIDANGWDLLMNESGILTFMDSKARYEWREKINKCDTPELTADNIKATFENLYGARGDMFERGVIRCFKLLSWDYKTNRPFLFGKRIIVSHMKSYGHFRSEKVDELADLQRVFCILDGKPEEDHRHGIYMRLFDADKGRLGMETGGVHEDTYMQIRWFKNGNAHITFRRPELVERMNKILAKHFPGVLAHDRHSAETGAGGIVVAGAETAPAERAR
jgi:Domain of unknown function (DUF4942)